MTHPAETELVKLAKIQPFKKGDRQKFLNELMDGVDRSLDKLGEKKADAVYDALSQDAQDWYQDTLNRRQSNPEADLREFENGADDDEQAHSAKRSKGRSVSDDDVPFDDNGDAEDEAPKKRAAKGNGAAKPSKARAARDEEDTEEEEPVKKTATKTATKKADSKPARKAAAPRKPGKLNAVHKLILKHPKKTAAELHEMLHEDGSTASLSTISTVRSDFIRIMRTLDAGGWLAKANPFPVPAEKD